MAVGVTRVSCWALLALAACSPGSNATVRTSAPQSVRGTAEARAAASAYPGPTGARASAATREVFRPPTSTPTVDLSGMAPAGAAIGAPIADWGFLDPLGRDLKVFRFDLKGVQGALLVEVSPERRLLWSTAGSEAEPAGSTSPSALPSGASALRAIEVTNLESGKFLPGILARDQAELEQHVLDIIDISADPVTSRRFQVSAGPLSTSTRFGVSLNAGGVLGHTTDTAILEVSPPAISPTLLFYPAPGGTPGSRSPLRHTAAASGRTVFVDLDADGTLEAVTNRTDSTWTVLGASAGGWEERPDISEVVAPPPQFPPDGAPLPPLPADLYFTRGRAVVRWPSQGGTLETVLPQSPEAPLAPVESRTTGAVPRRPFRVAADGSPLVALVSPVNEDDESEAQFMSLDLSTGATTLLPVRGGIGLQWGTARDWVLTPDGQWVVYVGLGIAPPGLAVIPAPYAASPPGYGTVIAQSTADPDVFEEVAFCGSFDAGPEHGIRACSADVAVSPDGKRVAFSDGEGLRVAALPGAAGDGTGEGGSTEMIVPHHYGPYEADVTVRTPGEWSPDGRLLLAREGHYEGSATSLVDLAAHTAQSLENTWEYSGPVSGLAWAQDSGSVIHARAHDGGYPFGQFPLTRISATNPDQVESLLPVVNVGSAQLAAYQPATLPDTTVYFMLRGPPGGYRDNGLFVIRAGSKVWQRLHTLPPDEPDDEGYPPNTAVLWADGAAAFLVTDSDPEWDPLAAGEKAFVGATEGEAWDASEVLEGGWWFAWGPAGQRPGS